MTKKTRMGAFIALLAIILLIGGILALSRLDGIRQFLGFSVTITNQLDTDIAYFEVGTYREKEEGKVVKLSTATYNKPLKSGDKRNFRPDITLGGQEGGIYLEYQDPDGNIVQKGICSYTESITGYSKVTITKDQVLVDEKCW